MPQQHTYTLRDRSKLKPPQTLIDEVKKEVTQHVYELRKNTHVDYKPFFADSGTEDQM